MELEACTIKTYFYNLVMMRDEHSLLYKILKISYISLAPKVQSSPSFIILEAHGNAWESLLTTLGEPIQGSNKDFLHAKHVLCSQSSASLVYSSFKKKIAIFQWKEENTLLRMVI